MRFTLLLACLALAACGGQGRNPPPAVSDADALRARLGSAGCVVASLLVKVQPDAGEGELFTLRLWAAADGSLRLRGQKLEVDFLEAAVAADGVYQAWLPRETVATSGRLGGADDPPLLRDLGLLLSEARHGPLPSGVTVDVAPTGAWTWTEGDRRAELTFGGDGLPSGKRLLAGDGSELRRLAYARWSVFEGLQRPSVVELRAAGDAATYTIRLRSLDAPPVISPERMRLVVPADVRRVTPEAFAAGMGVPGTDAVTPSAPPPPSAR